MSNCPAVAPVVTIPIISDRLLSGAIFDITPTKMGSPQALTPIPTNTPAPINMVIGEIDIVIM